MEENSTRWLRRLITHALDIDRDVFDNIYTAKARRPSFRNVTNQTEVSISNPNGYIQTHISIIDD